MNIAAKKRIEDANAYMVAAHSKVLALALFHDKFEVDGQEAGDLDLLLYDISNLSRKLRKLLAS